MLSGEENIVVRKMTIFVRRKRRWFTLITATDLFFNKLLRAPCRLMPFRRPLSPLCGSAASSATACVVRGQKEVEREEQSKLCLKDLKQYIEKQYIEAIH